ncbi:hypothetical protein ACFXGT_17640 [Streptomyces sp. NPDC059352]|uniref:hypothetical protein n=1 Tax=Streptomyces sp. NPDC059352 TaxID=3346810 RepID=UPI0036856CB6
MMFGYSDDWWMVFLVPAVLWVPFGPFVMGGMGVWCAFRPGLRARLWSVLMPLLPVTVGAIVVVMPLSQENRTDDLIGYVLVYVLGITVLPWLLGWGITRVVRAVRAVRARRRTEVTGVTGTRSR